MTTVDVEELQRSPGERGWRAAFVVGLLGGGILPGWLRRSAFAPGPVSLPLAALAGDAVRLGARLGGGCRASGAQA